MWPRSLMLVCEFTQNYFYALLKNISFFYHHYCNHWAISTGTLIAFLSIDQLRRERQTDMLLVTLNFQNNGRFHDQRDKPIRDIKETFWLVHFVKILAETQSLRPNRGKRKGLVCSCRMTFLISLLNICYLFWYIFIILPII